MKYVDRKSPCRRLLRPPIAGVLLALVLALGCSGTSRAVKIFNNEAERLKRLAGYSDLVVLATVTAIDTVTTTAGEGTITHSYLHLRVERKLLGGGNDTALVVEGPGNTATDLRARTLELLARHTNLYPGSRQVFMLQADPHHRLRLIQGGLMEVHADTVLVESRWGGRRYLDNVVKPLAELGIAVGDYLRVEELASWFHDVERMRERGIAARHATFVAGGILVGLEPDCKMPEDLACYLIQVDTVFSVDVDSVKRSDARWLPRDKPGSPAARTLLEGTSAGRIIGVVLSPSARMWRGKQLALLLEPGPGNLWVAAFDGAGFQPVEGGTYLRTAWKGIP